MELVWLKVYDAEQALQLEPEEQLVQENWQHDVLAGQDAQI